MQPRTVLTDADPAGVGLDPGPIAAAVARLHSYEESTAGGPPLLAGAVALMGHHGHVVARDASGWALRWADAETELPRAAWVPVRTSTRFDLASISKLFTSIAVVQLVEEGAVGLQQPVATYLPEFAAAGKAFVTVGQLLTHTSGFTSWLPLWSAHPDRAARIAAVMDQPLSKPPGTTYLYSDLNLITLGVMVERLRRASLDAVVRDLITAPLGMTDTGYRPADRERTAATEFQAAPPRGLVHGEVHDENAWSLGGVAGHAGVFSTADDVAVLAQCLLDGGTYGGHRILRDESVDALVSNANGAFPDDAHGLGFELDQPWYMDALAGPRTAGHTGYTGTSIVIDFASRSFAILLTNRVHPSRETGSTVGARREWARALAFARSQPPHRGRRSWRTGGVVGETATLTTAPFTVPTHGARVDFDLSLEGEPTELLHLDRSTDGGSTWQRGALEVSDLGLNGARPGRSAGSPGRRWVQVRSDLNPGSQQLRWSHSNKAGCPDRAIAVDGILVTGRGSGAGAGVLLDGEREPNSLTAQGWALVSATT